MPSSLAVLCNIAAFTAETLPELAAGFGASIALRNRLGDHLYRRVRGPPLDGRGSALLGAPAVLAERLKWAWRAYLMIDPMAILPFDLGAWLALDLRVMRVLRLLRFFKLSR